jgi:FkbM family methyltransferase
VPRKIRSSLRPLRAALRECARAADRRLGTEFYWAVSMGRRVAPRVARGTGRLRVQLAALLYGSRRWSRPITLRLDLPGGTSARFTVPDYEAFKVLYEMFFLREYDIDLEPPPRRILDLGAHVGASVLFFRSRWPEAEIVAVEASPRLAGILERNVRGLGVEVRHEAVAAEPGYIGFLEGERSWTGTTAGASESTVLVPAVTLDQLLDEPVDLLKIDIEGAEFEVLEAATRLERVGAIVGEAHALPDAPDTRRLLTALCAFRVDAKAAKGSCTIISAARNGRSGGGACTEDPAIATSRPPS